LPIFLSHVKLVLEIYLRCVVDNREELEKLVEQYEEDTAHLSFHKADHPAFIKIVEMGWDAVPLLLENMQRKRSWIAIVALRDITGEHPWPAKHAGKIVELTKDWIKWGKQKGFLPAK